MNALITGGAGFIGSHLVEALLKRDQRVTALDDLSTGSAENLRQVRQDPRVRCIFESMMNRNLLSELVDEADTVYHLAAAVGVRRIIESPVRTIETNIKGTELVLECAAKKGKPVFVASTSEVYGKNRNVPFREDDDIVLGASTRSRWSYATSKLLDEFLALAYFKEKKVPVVIGRLFNTVGPRQTGRYGMVLPTFVRQALDGDPITVFGSGEQSRCFGYVEDVVEAIVRLMACDRAVGEVVNIGNTEEITLGELAQLVKDRVRSTSGIQFIPYDEAYASGFEDMMRRVPSVDKLYLLAGLIAGPSTGVARYQIAGVGSPGGAVVSSGTGTTAYEYYIVANDTTAVPQIQTWPMYVAEVKNNGTGSPVIKWPRISPTNGTDTLTYDVIRTTSPLGGIGVGYQAPFVGGCNGGSVTACGYVTKGMAQCAGLVCSFTDNSASATSAYTILQGNFQPNMLFWPGSIVSVNSTVAVATDVGGIVNVGNGTNPVEAAEFCQFNGAGQSMAWVACASSYTSSNNSVPNQTATLLVDGGQNGGGQTLTKGRLNFATSPYAVIQPHHVITLIDSNPGKTESYATYRPAADSADTWIGTDVPAGGAALTAGQLAFGAPVYISSYIGQVGNPSTGTFGERLTSTLKQFNVPIKTPGATLTLSTTSISANTCAAAQTATITGLTTASVVKWSFASTPIGVTGYGTGGLQISTFATANTANVVVCNITGSSITPGAMILNLRAEL